MSTTEHAEAYAGYQEFLASRKTLVISSTDEQGRPFVSYAPYVAHDGKLYVYVSQIAEHYWHLVANDTVSVLLIADEADSANLFARQRVRFECDVTRLDDSGEHDEIFGLFREGFNASLINLLQT
ncbi:MAG TPA: pyridoxamine 5'-phosphate oxidase family protein, partial [Candidatus Avipropionibacterium avicola]|nr:pyridoxamine 5'-phosphate oxidase family protein [Candidatus Avipropionibacterium avicola]